MLGLPVCIDWMLCVPGSPDTICVSFEGLGHSSRSQEEDVARVVGATLSEDYSSRSMFFVMILFVWHPNTGSHIILAL